jgi:hypothetical protein
VLPGRRVPALRTNSVLFRDGLRVPADGGRPVPLAAAPAEVSPIG